MSFARTLEKETALVYDLRVEMDGQDWFFIIHVPPAKKEAFLNAIESDGGYRLEDFGTILYRGWGEPPDDIKHALHDRYGMYPELAT